MSRYSSTCVLINREIVRDSYGVAHDSEQRRTVACNVFSVSDSSYYAAAHAGVHIAARLQVRRVDYHGEKLVYYAGRVLNVSNVGGNAEFVTLTLEERNGENG